MAEPTREDVIAGAWAILTQSEQILRDTRAAFEAILNGEGYISVGDARRIVAKCDATLADAQEGRRTAELFLNRRDAEE